MFEGLAVTIVAVALKILKGLFGLDKPVEKIVREAPGEKINAAIQAKLRELDQALR